MSPGGMPAPHPRATSWSWERVLAAALTLPLAAVLANRLAGFASRGLVPLTDRAAALICVCLVLAPLVLDRRVRPIAGVSLIALTAGLVASALPLLLGRPTPDPSQLLAGALAVAVCTFAIGALARLLLPLAGDPAAAVGWVMLMALVVSAAPLWLAEPLDRGAPIADLLVAVNPLTLLGLGGAVDYPRDTWLYRHSPLGSVHYLYPSLTALFLCYLLAGSGALALAHRAEGQTRRQTVRPGHVSANPVETLP